MSARATLGVLLVAGFLASCGETTAAAWRIRFESDGGVVGATAVRLRLRVRSGGCAGTGIVYDADVSRTDAAPLFGEIGEGTFGFEAVARDATCTIVARGCTTTSLPLAAGHEVITQLESVMGEAPLCAPSACTDGACAPGSMDGGSADAGTD